MARYYTPSEISLIKREFSADGAAALAERMGRPVQRIRKKAAELGLYQVRKISARTVWTEEQDALIRIHWPHISRRSGAGMTILRLAALLNVSEWPLRNRAAALGLVTLRLKSKPWTEEELELLEKWSHLHVKSIADKFRKAGYTRSPAAVAVQRTRQELLVRQSCESYSGARLASYLGVNLSTVTAWIRRGWLKAESRTDAINARTGGPGDCWSIRPGDVREFVRQYVAHVNIVRANKFWLVDLLYGSKEAEAKVTRIQQSSGIRREAAGGIKEHRVSA